MLACLHDPGLPAREAELTFEYILAERLLRYAVEGIPRPNYDAIASQLFFNYLRQAGAVVLRGDRIEFNDGLPEALARFLADVEAIEAHIETEPAQRVKARLLEFTNRYTDFDEERRDYAHISFFAEVKQRLGV
jgi:hypothetical protein